MDGNKAGKNGGSAYAFLVYLKMTQILPNLDKPS